MNNKLKNKRINSSLLAVIILILILVCAFILFFEVNNYRKIKQESIGFYYNFAGTKVEFNGRVTYDADKKIISIDSDNVTLTSSPLYYSNSKEKVILPSLMEIIYPYKVSPMYKLGVYSYIYYVGKSIYTDSEKSKGRLYDCFLYDGKDLYFFIENTTVIVNGNKYNLSPLSYAKVGLNSVELYDKDSDKIISITSINGTVNAYTDEYTINLTDDTFTYKNNYYILIKNIENLNFYEFNK